MAQNQTLKRRILISGILFLCLVAVNAHVHKIRKSVAIIGAGAGGSSAAFWLSKAFPSTGNINVSTTIFEAADYIGGRSTVIPIKDDPELGVDELGASIFVEANWNMMNATKLFGLEFKDLRTVKTKFGVWDGQKFIFQETGSYWWDTTKALLRYGIAPFRVRSMVLSAVDRLARAYNHDISPAFSNIKNFTSFLNFDEETSRTAQNYFIKKRGVEAKYIEQIVQSATRINYAQNINVIHALGALVSMVPVDAKTVKGGNFQIFQKFIEKAGAELRIKTKVVGIKKMKNLKTGEILYEVESGKGRREMFDAVILAAPIHQTKINFNNIPAAVDLLANPPAFQTVHVTFVAGIRDPTYFGFDDVSKIPNLIITTADTSLFPEQHHPFTTFAEHHHYNETGESIIKMFSATEVPDKLLDALFVTRSWTRRHAWQAYPVLTPVVDAEREKLVEETRKRFLEEDLFSISNIRNKVTETLRNWGVLPQKQAEVVKPVEEKKEADPLELKWPPVVLDEEHKGEGDGGVFYVNGFENFISCMETETIASKNIVRLLHKQWCKDCKPFGDGWTEEAAEPIPANSKDEL